MSRQITVIGLGAGDIQQLTLGAYKLLTGGRAVFLRTKDHPIANWLNEQNIEYKTFDDLYEQKERFDEVYTSICQKLIQSAEKADVIYAVPGHPMVAEKTVQLLKEKANEGEIALEIVGGQSFLDQLFVSFGLDPIEGFQLLDGCDLQYRQLNPEIHTVITQVYDRLVASDVKLTLMEMYPDDYPVWVCHKLGFKEGQEILRVPLYELDHQTSFGNFSFVYIPKAEESITMYRSFSTLREIIKTLRSPEGCPWDREQTHKSLKKYLIEETYEVLEAIDEEDQEALCEELGDVLLQIMLHSQIAEDEGDFTVTDVIEAIGEKMVRRHPHVFKSSAVESVEEVLTNWQEIKKQEKEEKGKPVSTSILSDIPKPLPALMKAVKLQKKAAQVGFDWKKVEEIYDKVEEEIGEMKEATGEEKINEIGDVLFAVVNVARFLKIDPEEALSRTNLKFKERFEYIEQQLNDTNKTFQDTTIEEMEQWWQQSKKIKN
jgi:tetrapyrrole methylase family protein/MazG family protein